MPDLSRFRPILWAAIGVCLVAGLVAVPIVGDGRDDDNVRAGEGGWTAFPGASTSTSVVEGTLSAEGGVAPAGDGGDGGDVAPAGAPGGGDGGDAAPGARSGGGATPAGPPASSAPATTEAPAPTSPPTTAAPTEDLGPPGDPGPATVPRAGSYRYKATDSRGERETTTKIEDRPPTGSPERRQLVTIRGDGFDTDNEVSWRGDGVYVLSTVITFGDNKGTCDWNPDTVQLKLPIAKGTSWESSSTCQMTGIGPTPIPLNRKLTGKFLEVRRVRIAGQVIDVWAIEATEHLDGGGQSGDRVGTVLFSPKHGVTVSQTGKATTSQGTYDYRSEIQNLDPE